MTTSSNAASAATAPLQRLLADPAATEALGAALASAIEPGLQIWLEGDLGMGKTCLCRGLLRKLDHHGKVKSPTYTLIEPYTLSRLNLYHFDFYRFNSPEEFLDAGLDEYFAGEGVCVVEWPQKALPYLPPADLVIRLERAGEGRIAQLDENSAAGRTCLNKLIHALPDT